MDYSPLPKRRKRLCSYCLKELGLKSIISSKGTYSITHGICERHFCEQTLKLGLTSETIDSKILEMKLQLGEKAFCFDLEKLP